MENIGNYLFSLRRKRPIKTTLQSISENDGVYWGIIVFSPCSKFRTDSDETYKSDHNC